MPVTAESPNTVISLPETSCNPVHSRSSYYVIKINRFLWFLHDHNRNYSMPLSYRNTHLCTDSLKTMISSTLNTTAALAIYIIIYAVMKRVICCVSCLLGQLSMFLVRLIVHCQWLSRAMQCWPCSDVLPLTKFMFINWHPILFTCCWQI